MCTLYMYINVYIVQCICILLCTKLTYTMCIFPFHFCFHTTPKHKWNGHNVLKARHPGDWGYMYTCISGLQGRPWRIMLETLPIFLFFYSPIIHLFFFFIILFFSIMPVLILQILILRCDTQSHTDNTLMTQTI